MPSIAVIHPQVVHFVVALAFVGVGARLVSLLPLGDRFKFSNAMATWLIVLSAVASVVAVQSGTDAHGPVERVPGSRTAVTEHEDAGEWARDALLVLAVLELAALATSGKPAGKAVRGVAAVGGLVGLATVYRAADLGGDLVYNHAGGIGLRSGDSADVRHLLVAGLYHEAMKSRSDGRNDDAARLITELARQMPADTSVKFLAAESQIRDQHNGRAALAMLDSVSLADSSRFATRKMMLTADAYAAAGVPDSARLTYEALKARFPQNQRIQDQVNQALQRLATSPAPAARDTAHAAPGRGAPRARP